MTTIHPSTKYDPTPKYWICTNPNCNEGHPGWATSGTEAGKVCFSCKQPLRKTDSEPTRQR